MLDMAGNVWEWTRSLWVENRSQPDFGYPYDSGDGREDLEVGGRRVVRGGSFLDGRGLARCAFRNWDYPDGRRLRHSGFRVVASPVHL